MATNQPREEERAGLKRDPAEEDAARPTAERGAPQAEYGQYGLVREGSTEAAGLTEEQIRGIKPTR